MKKQMFYRLNTFFNAKIHFFTIFIYIFLYKLMLLIKQQQLIMKIKQPPLLKQKYLQILVLYLLMFSYN